MIIIDPEKWDRKKHYDYFKNMEFPYFNICLNMEITNLYNYCKNNNISIFLATIFLITKAANKTEYLRMRIQKNKVILFDKNKVILFDTVHPGITIMGERGLYNNCTLEYINDFKDFIKISKITIEKSKLSKFSTNTQNGREDLLYMTTLPWINFTAITHPVNLKNPDSIPRIAWGKITKSSDNYIMPFALQAHHSLMDGYHASLVLNDIQENFNNIEIIREKNIII